MPIETKLSWQVGHGPPGVRFGREAHVRLLDGAFADECATVRELLALSPEPCYRVEIDATHVSLDVRESSLAVP